MAVLSSGKRIIELLAADEGTGCHRGLLTKSQLVPFSVVRLENMLNNWTVYIVEHTDK